MPYQTFPITLRVLCVLRGFILINRRDRKGSGNGVQLKAIYPLSIGLQLLYFFFGEAGGLCYLLHGIAELL